MVGGITDTSEKDRDENIRVSKRQKCQEAVTEPVRRHLKRTGKVLKKLLESDFGTGSSRALIFGHIIRINITVIDSNNPRF